VRKSFYLSVTGLSSNAFQGPEIVDPFEGAPALALARALTLPSGYGLGALTL
jgi:hypothetical protein